jgi:hypothetical protein
MQRISFALSGALLVLVALTLSPSPAHAQSPSPSAAASATPAANATPNVDPALIARAKSWLKMLQAGKIDRSQLAAVMNAQLTDDKLAAVAKQIAPLGDPVTFEPITAGVKDGQNYTVFALAFGNSAKLNYVFATDPSGKISGLLLLPPAGSQ